MESPGGGYPGAAAQSREPLSGCRRPRRHSGFFSNPTAGRLRPWGREGLFSLQQDSGHKLGDENRIKGRGRDLAFWLHPHPHLFPTQNLGSLEREVCTMSPGGGARAAVVFHPQPPAPTPVCPGHRLQLQAPSLCARPSVRTSASCRHVVHPRGSGSCARKGGPRRFKLWAEVGALGIQTQPRR